MFKIEALFINPEYPKELEHHNTDLVCYVVRRSDNKVCDVAVVKRRSLHEWFVQRRAKFVEEEHFFVLGTTSIIGVLRGFDAKEFIEQAKEASKQVDVMNDKNFNPNVN